MSGFYRRALSKIERLTIEQARELLVSASGEILRLEAVLDSLPSGILVCDEKHFLTKANKSALRLLPLNHPEGNPGSAESGRRFQEGCPLWALIPDERIANFFRQTLLSGDHVLEREMDIEVQGHSRLLSMSVHPLVDMKRITGSLVYIEDITGKRNREVRLRRAENLASLTTLAASIAHEIKNPLGSISIHLQLMQRALNGQPNELINKYLGILNEEVDRLNRIVVDFLFAVRPMTLELREENINSIITAIAEFISVELEQSDIRLLLELDERLPPAFIDERYMKQVLLNLIKNAQSAMPSGGLLTIATVGTDSEIRISICDTGIGISEENLAKIFEPYFTTRENGTGLGLTLVFKIIREHRGEISVESKEGGGSNFEIILPVPQKEQRLIAYNKSAGGTV
jgi:signal transduction histidine kinase